jgi:hypothetical protein
MDAAITPPAEVDAEPGSPVPRARHRVPGVREALEAAFQR